jgi:hypothetical protein
MMNNNNQKQLSEPSKPGVERRRDLSKATAMNILGPSKNLNKENEGVTSRKEDNSSLINVGGIGHSGDGVTKQRENRMI